MRPLLLAVAASVGFVSSRRGGEGAAPSLAVRENLFMNPSALAAGWRLVDGSAERRQAAEVLGRFGVDVGAKAESYRLLSSARPSASSPCSTAG